MSSKLQQQGKKSCYSKAISSGAQAADTTSTSCHEYLVQSQFAIAASRKQKNIQVTTMAAAVPVPRGVNAISPASS